MPGWMSARWPLYGSTASPRNAGRYSYMMTFCWGCRKRGGRQRHAAIIESNGYNGSVPVCLGARRSARRPARLSSARLGSARLGKVLSSPRQSTQLQRRIDSTIDLGYRLAPDSNQPGSGLDSAGCTPSSIRHTNTVVVQKIRRYQSYREAWDTLGDIQ